jgi:prepilin-type N-terminal cleavage/methylation domain-containing protein/prepilin-type processing-associated H-X9-DG protein
VRKGGFTLFEILAVVAVMAVLTSLFVTAGWKVYERSSLAISANNVRQLAVGGSQYLADHNYTYWKYREDDASGTYWWWGYETYNSQSSGEGSRAFDPLRGPLAGYVPSGLHPDPSFSMNGSAFKPKYKSGYIGVGYNVVLGGGFFGTSKKPMIPLRYWQLSDPAKVVVFATSAQVYPFSSTKTPLIEEFYGINESEITVHFRHDGSAMVAFADGSAGFLPMDPSTRDNRAPKANIGRFAPIGSFRYLR